MPFTPTYATPDELREEYGVPAGLPEDEALHFIEQAEVWVDGRLLHRPVDPLTGRRVTLTDVEPAQWEQLSRATVLLAAAFYRDPTIDEQPRFRRVKGPKFETEDPIPDAAIPRAVTSALAASGLVARRSRWGSARA